MAIRAETTDATMARAGYGGWRFVIQQRGEPAAVLMGYQDYMTMIELLEDLEDDPRLPGSRKLFDDICRIRVGGQRVTYRLDDQRAEVLVGKIVRCREDTYKAVEDLF